jgi:hypothetical protein
LENNDDTRLINKLGPDGFPLLEIVLDIFSTAGGNDVDGGVVGAMVRDREGVKERRRVRKAIDRISCCDCKQPAAEERTNAEIRTEL